MEWIIVQCLNIDKMVKVVLERRKSSPKALITTEDDALSHLLWACWVPTPGVGEEVIYAPACGAQPPFDLKNQHWLVSALAN